MSISPFFRSLRPRRSLRPTVFLALLLFAPSPILSTILTRSFFFALFRPFGSIFTAPLISLLVLAPCLFLPVLLCGPYPRMLSVSSFGRLSLRLLLLPRLPLFLRALLLLRGPTAFGVLLPLPLFSGIIWSRASWSPPLSLLLFIFLTSNSPLTLVSVFALLWLPPLFSLSLLPFSLSCPVLLLYIFCF